MTNLKRYSYTTKLKKAIRLNPFPKNMELQKIS